MASLFGISEGAARTCLWRMVSTGELTSDDGSYALAGRLLERRQRVDEASRIDDAAARPWDGTWELAIVSLERRPAADRLELRKAAAALHWPNSGRECGYGRTTLTRNGFRCRGPYWTSSAPTFTVRRPTSPPTRCDRSFRLMSGPTTRRHSSRPWRSNWRRHQRTRRCDRNLHLRVRVVDRGGPASSARPAATRRAHCGTWPGHALRSTYRRFDEAFKQRMNSAFRQSPR